MVLHPATVVHCLKVRFKGVFPVASLRPICRCRHTGFAVYPACVLFTGVWRIVTAQLAAANRGLQSFLAALGGASETAAAGLPDAGLEAMLTWLESQVRLCQWSNMIQAVVLLSTRKPYLVEACFCTAQDLSPSGA